VTASTTEPTRSPSVDDPRDAVPWRVLAVTVTGAFIVSLDLSIVNVAFPSIRASFGHTSTATLSWVLSIYSVVFGSLLLGGGRLADRSGRRRWFARGLVLFSVGSAWCASAPAAGWLISGRAVQAVGAALLMPASVGLLLAACPPRARTQAMSLFGGLAALAVAVGPSAGALLIEAGGWRMAFVVNLPIAGALLVVLPRVVSESSIGGARPDPVGIIAVCLAVASLALAISQGATWGWTSWRVLGAFALAAVVGPAAVVRSSRHPSPAIDLEVLRNRAAAVANAATLLYAIGFFALLLSMVLFLTGVWGYSTLRAGVAITPSPLIVTALSSRVGRVAERIGVRAMVVGGSLVIAAGEGWLVLFVRSDPDYLRSWLPGSVLIGVGVVMTMPILSATSVAGLSPERYSIGGALNQTARQMGAVLGIAILVAIMRTPADAAQAEHRLRITWMVCMAASCASSAVSVLQPKRKRTPVVSRGPSRAR